MCNTDNPDPKARHRLYPPHEELLSARSTEQEMSVRGPAQLLDTRDMLRQRMQTLQPVIRPFTTMLTAKDPDISILCACSYKPPLLLTPKFNRRRHRHGLDLPPMASWPHYPMRTPNLRANIQRRCFRPDEPAASVPILERRVRPVAVRAAAFDGHGFLLLRLVPDDEVFAAETPEEEVGGGRREVGAFDVGTEGGDADVDCLEGGIGVWVLGVGKRDRV